MIATIKSWNITEAERFKARFDGVHEVVIITSKEELTLELVKKTDPRYIFFPHWSYIIPREIYDNWECVVFHMTDLPYGRGGSPLQNLIVRGFTETKMTALRADKNVDAGPIYLKEPLSLEESANDIYVRASKLIFEKMIPEIVMKQPSPKEQPLGEYEQFKRRTKEMSEIKEGMPLEKIFDHIRMLDAEGYPQAYIDYGEYRLSFSDANYRNGKLSATVNFERLN